MLWSCGKTANFFYLDLDNVLHFIKQVFIDVDCGDWAGYYSASSLFKDILKAEDVYKRGYKDSSEKRDLIMNITGLDSFTLSLLGTVPGKLCEFYGNSYRSTWELRRACSISKNNPGATC